MSTAQTASKDKKTEEKDKSKKDDKVDASKKVEEKPTPTAEIKSNIALIERAVADLEPRFTHRVLRPLSALRKRLDNKILRDAIEENYPTGVCIASIHARRVNACTESAVKASLLSWLPAASPADQSMDIDAAARPNGPAIPTPPPKPTSDPIPEVEIYFRLLLIHHLHTSKDKLAKSVELSKETVDKVQQLNRRSMDPIAAKVWFAVERSYELGGDLADARPWVPFSHTSPVFLMDGFLLYISRLFLAAQRTAALRHDDDTQASLINRLLRSYLHYSLYDQADKLVSKTTFPASASNPQFARYHYFLGRIKAVQLNYTAAHTNLQQTIRRAPPAKTAPGFYQAVHKLFVVVELLMGDIPDRSTFRHPVLQKALQAYFDIVKGDLIIMMTAWYNSSLTLTYSCPDWISFRVPSNTHQACFTI